MTNNSFQAKSGPRVLKELDSSLEGLSTAQAKSRLEKFGFNEITEKKAIRPVFIFLKQFNSWLIYILLGAALFSFLTGHLFDVYIILAVLLVNGCMGFIQEFKAEKAILALKKMVVLFAKVLRNGELLKIPAKELVPGDIIILQEGDKVPADGRLLEVNNLRSAEAALTGESQPVSKQIDVLAENVPLAEQKNMVWTSTLIVAGQGKAIVTATGSQTALGQIANKLGKIEKPVTHFKIKTDILARQMAGIAILATGIIFSLGFLIRSLGFEQTFRFAVASLVSGIPEGLPIILVIVLAIGASRMAKRKAIVRNLQATENLGVANVIATDKTGTLTENTMNVERIILSNKEEFAVSGNGWQPEGRFTQADKIIFPLENEKLAKLLHISAVCNKARLLKEKTTEQKEVYKIIGDPTEGALVVLAEKAGLKKEMINQQEILLDDLPFSSALKLRASLVSLAGKEEKTKELYVVGAP
ncbi:HAD-IC family P-type ATPase, partial [Candidatus Gribaldobacteria bacterium]|nr:HAD-IC family P-type ATPase [Candidatus Gribaldobacteria bacterium]